MESNYRAVEDEMRSSPSCSAFLSTCMCKQSFIGMDWTPHRNHPQPALQWPGAGLLCTAGAGR